jgi:hypothetical protein
MTGVPAGHGLDHHQAERLGPIDGRQQGDGTAEEGRFLLIADLADILDVWLGEQRANLLLEIVSVDVVHFSSDLDRQPTAPRNVDRAIHRFLR